MSRTCVLQPETIKLHFPMQNVWYMMCGSLLPGEGPLINQVYNGLQA